MLYRFLAITLVFTGCSESHPTEEDSGGITFDANFPDAGMDAGPLPSNVGAECGADSDCVAPADTCITDLPGGYCSTFCSADEDCGDGAVCVAVDMGTSLCLTSCEPGANECRAGYGCSTAAGVPVCLPGCEDDSDCATGQECEVGGGFSGAGACFDPTSAVGDPCTSEGDCPAGGFCRTAEEGWPGGSCGLPGCDFENDDCPAGSHCVVTGRFPFCIDDCTTDDECRDGYTCIPQLGFPERTTCQPTFDESALGVACSQRRNPCLGGFCLREGEYGFPDSYCIAVGCDADTPCPGDGVCFTTGSGVGVCFDGCTATTDCRAGYTCRPSNSEDASSPLGCLPGCENDGECSNDGFVCNTGTGLCGEPFMAANLGEPCAGPDDCAGGACLTEAEDGWPAGTCTYPGCRLSGTGMMSACPSGGVCTDDGAGDPTLGVCVDACTVGSTTCRPGYACAVIDPIGDPLAGACRPACTSSDQCGEGRTCQVSGLCE